MKEADSIADDAYFGTADRRGYLSTRWDFTLWLDADDLWFMSPCCHSMLTEVDREFDLYQPVDFKLCDACRRSCHLPANFPTHALWTERREILAAALGEITDPLAAALIFNAVMDELEMKLQPQLGC